MILHNIRYELRGSGTELWRVNGEESEAIAWLSEGDLDGWWDVFTDDRRLGSFREKEPALLKLAAMQSELAERVAQLT